jgi:hypothetical protein
MPRCRSRAVKVHARSVARRHVFEVEIDDRFNEIITARTSDERIEAMDHMIDLLKRISSSDLRLWTFRDQLRDRVATNKEGREDIDITMAMIAQIVNQHLAACTPGSVRRRHEYAR